jgi:hypothetical protein
MDLQGFETINSAFTATEIGATVTPQPTAEENVRFVTVETDAGVPPQRVLNALGKANLMYCDGPKDTDTPELQTLGIQPGSATFEDMNDSRW